jgi:hypothetical protein
MRKKAVAYRGNEFASDRDWTRANAVGKNMLRRVAPEFVKTV